MLSHADPGTVPLGSQIHGTQPWDSPADGKQNNTTTQNRLLVTVTQLSLLTTRRGRLLYVRSTDYAASHGPLAALPYSGGVNSCCRSCGRSWYTACPPPPPGTGIVRSAYHTPPLARCRGCHTHRADSPGSCAAPGCGNHDDKCHRDGLLHGPKKKVEKEGRGVTKRGANNRRIQKEKIWNNNLVTIATKLIPQVA